MKLINHNLPLPEKLSGLDPPCQTNLNCEKLSGGWTRSTVRAAGAEWSTRGSQRNLLTSSVSLWASLIDCFRSWIPKRHSERQERSLGAFGTLSGVRRELSSASYFEPRLDQSVVEECQSGRVRVSAITQSDHVLPWLLMFSDLD